MYCVEMTTREHVSDIQSFCMGGSGIMSGMEVFGTQSPGFTKVPGQCVEICFRVAPHYLKFPLRLHTLVDIRDP